MPRHYSLDFKKSAVLITKSGVSTMLTANDLNIPLKTLEHWITAYHKNPNIFDPDYISPQEKIKQLEKIIKQQNETIQILKKSSSLLCEPELIHSFITRESSSFSISSIRK